MRTGLVLSLCVLTGCSLAPRYQRPETPSAAVFKEAGNWQVAAPADTAPRGPWWEPFNDPTLNALQTSATEANQNLKAAFAQLQMAHAQTRIAGAAYLPTIKAADGVTRKEVSTNSPSYSPLRPDTYNDLVAGGYFSYELDLFGRIRNTVAGARATEQATAGDVAYLELSVRAELTADYFSLRALDTAIALWDQTVTHNTRALALTQHLYQAGTAMPSDVDQATTVLSVAQTQAADVRLRRAQTEHAIAVLVGQSPSTFHLDPNPLTVGIAPSAPIVELPSTLLQRRPDIAAAERRVAAANAGIGVARAAYFPVLNISASLGRESLLRSTLFKTPSRFWSVQPQGVLTVFDGGLHRAQSAAAHAAFDEQVAQYRNTVLSAFQDVEDNLAALHELELESDSAQAAANATQRALNQANFRLKAGAASYLDVVATENAALAAKLALTNIEARRINASILLIRSLGGDWINPAAAHTHP